MRQRWIYLFMGVFGFVAIGPLVLSCQADAPDDDRVRQELEALWSDLYGAEPTASNALLKLYKIADVAVPFLKEKLQPLELKPDACRQLLKELGSEEEREWKAAWEKLDYLDPRLAIDLQTLMNEVDDVPARTRMVELCGDRLPDTLAGKNVNIRAVGDEGFNFFDGRASWWAEHKVERMGSATWNPKKAWNRAARCIALLEQIGTPEALKVLQQLAAGHPDAFPTKAAVSSIIRIKKAQKAAPVGNP